MKRLLLIPFGVLLGLLVLETGLQVASWVVLTKTTQSLPSSWATGNVRILCLGDSNTYGVRVPREQTWPAQLESIWNETVGEPRIEVLNLGFPGTNSSRVVRDLPRLLDLLQPDLTIVMVGVNDFWTVPFPIDEKPKDSGVVGFVKRRSRIYRAFLLLQRGRPAPDLTIVKGRENSTERGGFTARVGDEEFSMDFAKVEGRAPGAVKGLRRDLQLIADQARETNTRLYFMTYPARLHSFYALTNPVIRRMAAKTETPLIDLTAVFEPLCPELSCPEYLLADDHHPNAKGYRVVAETIRARLPKPADPIR